MRQICDELHTRTNTRKNWQTSFSAEMYLPHKIRENVLMYTSKYKTRLMRIATQKLLV